MIFNLYVSDLHEVTPSLRECVQYADDTSLYSHFNVKELDSRAVDMNESCKYHKLVPGHQLGAEPCED